MKCLRCGLDTDVKPVPGNPNAYVVCAPCTKKVYEGSGLAEIITLIAEDQSRSAN